MFHVDSYGMPLIPGSRLGPYEVKEPIGAGGMGEVYRAHDARLRRDVALKILTPDAVGDASRGRRFELEARALAALSHPNIVGVYDVGTDGSASYIITELIAGDPLRGRLTVAKVVDAARQIASGLAAAHDAGIIHRDLKPENILRTSEGRVKILDFGLVKVREGLTESADTVTLRTRPGTVVGTVAYMSPEQVRGEEVDHRSDLFSVGLILYELLAGERAFRGGSSVEVMNAILNQEAPALPDTVPAALRQIVSHCLEKNPRDRFQSARDLEFALKLVAETDPGSLPQGSHGGRRTRTVFPILAAAILLAAGLLAGRWWWLTPTAPNWSGVGLGGPEVSWAPQLSPDGHTLALAALVDGSAQPVVMNPESGNYIVLSRDRTHGYVWQVAWSADGTLVYYDRRADGPKGIFSVPALGGEQRLVLADAESPRAASDGSLLVYRLNPDRRLEMYRFWPETGKLKVLPFFPAKSLGTVPAAVAAFPDRAEALAYGQPAGAPPGGHPHLYVINIDTGESRRFAPALEEGADLISFDVPRNSDSVLLSRRRGSLCEVDAVSRTGGSRARVLFTSTLPVKVLAGSADGSIYGDQSDVQNEVIRFSPAGGAVETLARFPEIADAYLCTLAQGQAVIGAVISGRMHLVAIEKGKQPYDLLTTSEEISSPFAASSNEIAFALGPAPRQTIGIASLSTGRITRRLAASKGVLTGIAFSPDGSIYFGAGGSIWRADQDGVIHRITAGETLAAGARALIVHVRENDKVRLVRVSPEGAVIDEVESADPIVEGPLSPNALAADGRLLSPLAPINSWSFVPGLTDGAGRLERIPITYEGDFHSMAWAPDDKIIALSTNRRSRIWKFSPRLR